LWKNTANPKLESETRESKYTETEYMLIRFELLIIRLKSYFIRRGPQLSNAD